ncbi:MAG: alanine--tRNA ligase, partial [Nanoarchaeota archaeon]|nr:alanine--tRNA ligase [Nanoarchaeota archaeon]
GRAEAEKKYGFTLYQGGAIPMKTLRVISVLDSDIEACGGIHMMSTGGIGFVKIVSSQKIQDGVVRLKYVVRDFAQDFINEKQRILLDACDVFSVDDSSLVKTCEKFFNDWKAQKKEIDVLKNQLKASIIDSIFSSKKKEFKVDGISDIGFLMEIFTEVISKFDSFKLVGDKFVIASQGVKVEGYKKEIKKGKFNIYVM